VAVCVKDVLQPRGVSARDTRPHRFDDSVEVPIQALENDQVRVFSKKLPGMNTLPKGSGDCSACKAYFQLDVEILHAPEVSPSRADAWHDASGQAALAEIASMPWWAALNALRSVRTECQGTIPHLRVDPQHTLTNTLATVRLGRMHEKVARFP